MTIGHQKERDYTPTGLRVEQPYENDRNADCKPVLKAIIKEVFGTDECMVGHHISFETQDKRPDGFVYTITQEYPSIDTLMFDHAVAKKLWSSAWQSVLTTLALTPTEKRDEALADFYYKRNAPDHVAPPLTTYPNWE